MYTPRAVTHYVREALMSYLRNNHITGEEKEVLDAVVKDCHVELRRHDEVFVSGQMDLVEDDSTTPVVATATAYTTTDLVDVDVDTEDEEPSEEEEEETAPADSLRAPSRPTPGGRKQKKKDAGDK